MGDVRDDLFVCARSGDLQRVQYLVEVRAFAQIKRDMVALISLRYALSVRPVWAIFLFQKTSLFSFRSRLAFIRFH